MNTTLLIEEDDLKHAALRLRAINNKLRKNILRLIHNNSALVVHDIHISLNIEQPVASQHLAILRNANLVITKREGRYIYYSLNYEQLEFIHKTAKQLLEITEGSFYQKEVN
jgi:DNA-binding transcriptional ArsR family regulator